MSMATRSLVIGWMICFVGRNQRQNLHPERSTRAKRQLTTERTMKSASELSQQVKDAVNTLVLDKKISRPTLIEALEDAAEDISSLLDSLRDDERRANGN